MENPHRCSSRVVTCSGEEQVVHGPPEEEGNMYVETRLQDFKINK
jgi:hypothetical protein